MHDVERSCIQPRGFTIAERVIQVEAAFHALEERESFEVADRNTVLVDHRSVISAQRQTLLSRQGHKKEFHAAAQLRAIDMFRIAVPEAIKLAITNGRGFARHVERL